MHGRALQILTVFTGAPANRLDDPKRDGTSRYPMGLDDCRSLEELQHHWEALSDWHRRLLLLAPPVDPWLRIANEWFPSFYVSWESRPDMGIEEFQESVSLLSESSFLPNSL